MVSDDRQVQGALPPLPAIDEITAGTDVSGFLLEGVPAALRNAALRRLWSVDPAIRDYVGDARDYAYDWNIPGGVPGFGPIEPGCDVQGMVSRLFSRARAEDPPDAAEALSDDREQALTDPLTALSPESVAEADEPPGPAPQLAPAADLGPAGIGGGAPVPAPEEAAVPRSALRSRHGGATPV